MSTKVPPPTNTRNHTTNACFKKKKKKKGEAHVDQGGEEEGKGAAQGDQEAA
jgi:hypothetical protein